MLLIPCFLTSSPKGTVKTQQHLVPEQVLVISLSALVALDSTPKTAYFRERAHQSFRQENIGTPPPFSFFCVVSHDGLPIWLGRHICFSVLVHLADTPGDRIKS